VERDAVRAERGGERQILLMDLIHATFANHYDSDGLGSLHAITPSKSIYMKTLEVHD
jgi:hypothetical protein